MKNVMLVLAVSFLAVACGKDNKNPFTNAKEAIEDKDLQGTFQSECDAEIVDSIRTGLMTLFQTSVKTSRTIYSFKGANVTKSTVFYAKTQCEDEAYTFTEKGEFNVVKEQKTADGAKFIDFKMKSLSIKVNSEAGATSANAIGLCDIKDWANGSEKEINGAASVKPSCYGVALPRDNQNVYRIDGGNTLLLGSEVKENATARPTSVSKVAYTKTK